MSSIATDDVSDDELLEEAATITGEREEDLMVLARERILQRRAQEAAEAKRLADERDKQEQHIASVIAAHTALADFGYEVADFETRILPEFVQALVNLQTRRMDVVPLLSQAGRSPELIDQAFVHMVAVILNAASVSGFPTECRVLFRGRIQGAPEDSLFSYLDRQMRDLMRDLSVTTPQEASHANPHT